MYAVKKLSQKTIQIESTDIQVIEVQKRACKIKWLTRFFKSYKSNVGTINEEHIGARAKFLIAMMGNRQLGFVRLTNKSHHFVGLSETWCLSDLYVKPPYRHQGIGTKLSAVAISDYQTKLACLDQHLLESQRNHYRALGFTTYIVGQRSQLCWLYHRTMPDHNIRSKLL